MTKLTLSIMALLVAFSTFPQTTGSFTDTRDGKTYKTVTLGDQVWMAENLKFATHKDSAHYVGESHAYKGNIENYYKYGALYSWEVAQKACPEGWHLPSLQEWYTMINSFGDLYDENGKIPTKKETSKAEVKKRRQLFKEIYAALLEGGSSGFDVLFAGYRDPHAYQGVDLTSLPGYYYSLGSTGSFWSTDDDIEKGMFKKLKAKGFYFSRWPKNYGVMPMRKSVGCSVRCVQD